MGDRVLHSALREMRTHLGDPRVLGGMAVVAVLLGVAGPFGTFEALPLPARFVYWAVIVLGTYGVGFATAQLAVAAFGFRIVAPWARVLVFGLLTGVPVTLAVLAVNFVAFGPHWLEAIAPLTLWFDATLVGLGVMTISEIVRASLRPAPPAPPAAPAPPPILARLPLPQRGQLHALVVQDHYVEVLTDRGRALLLMRLSDAIGETGGVAGVRIHRSHWVALAAVSRVVRTEGRLQVELPDGRRLGVSRGYLAAARAAGIS